MSDLSLRRSSVFSLNAAPRRSNTLNLQNFVLVGALLGLVSILSLAYLLPIGFVASYSLKSESQLGNGEILPMTQEIFMYNGERLLVYNVEIEGVTRKLALISSSRSGSVLIDPANPDAGTITTPQRAATLDPAVYLDPHPETFVETAQTMNLPLALRNTLAVALIGGVGVVISSAMVAYGFSRYRVPGANIMFFVLLSTMILPGQVTLIPLFILYQNLGWTGTILPLVVPHFFAGAYNVFLLRQYFLTIPIEMDEAARVDGANPLQTFLYIIVPQSKAALVTVAIFHFVFAWGDFFYPLIFTAGNRDAQTLAVVLQRFQQQFSFQPNQQMAGAFMMALPPLILFFFAQKTFIQGIVTTGVDK